MCVFHTPPPPFFLPPPPPWYPYTYTAASSSALREQWIEAKYSRKEFTKDAADNSPRRYLTGLCVCVPVYKNTYMYRGMWVEICMHMSWSTDCLAGEKQGPLMKKKRQSDSDVFRERLFVVKNGVLSYYRDRKVGHRLQ